MMMNIIQSIMFYSHKHTAYELLLLFSIAIMRMICIPLPYPPTTSL